MFDYAVFQSELTGLLSLYATQDRPGQEFELILRRRGERRRLAMVTAVPRPAEGAEPEQAQPRRRRPGKRKGG